MIKVKSLLTEKEVIHFNYNLIHRIETSPYITSKFNIHHFTIGEKDGRLKIPHIHHHGSIRVMEKKIKELFKEETQDMYFKKSVLTINQPWDPSCRQPRTTIFSEFHAFPCMETYSYRGWVNLTGAPKQFQYLYAGDTILYNTDTPLTHFYEFSSGILFPNSVEVPIGHAILFPSTLICRFQIEKVHFFKTEFLLHFGFSYNPLSPPQDIPCFPPLQDKFPLKIPKIQTKRRTITIVEPIPLPEEYYVEDELFCSPNSTSISDS